MPVCDVACCSRALLFDRAIVSTQHFSETCKIASLEMLRRSMEVIHKIQLSVAVMSPSCAAFNWKVQINYMIEATWT